MEKSIERVNGSHVLIDDKWYVNFCSSDYLGLAQDNDVREAAKQAIDDFGPGMSSVRFISGTTTLHKALERKIADYLKVDDCLVYSSAFMANLGLFEVLFDEKDIIFSDQLNHASLIDGMKLSPARKVRFAHNDIADLETHLHAEVIHDREDSKWAIVTEGIFSMDGDLSPLQELRTIADANKALLVVDIAHGTPLGTQADIWTGTLGKAFGSGMGGFVAGSQEIIDTLRSKSRTSLFSNALPPANCAAALVALEKIEERSSDLKLITEYAHSKFKEAGFDFSATTAIIPILTEQAEEFAQILWEDGNFVVPFAYPVVPKDKARVRIQITALHTPDQIHHLVASCVRARNLLTLTNENTSREEERLKKSPAIT